MNQMVLRNYVFSIPELKELNTAVKLALCDVAKHRVFYKGNIFISEKEACNTIYYITSGLVKAFYESEDKKEQIWAFFGEGSFCTCPNGIMGAKEAGTNFQAMEDTEMLYINKTDLRGLKAKFPEISTKAYEMLSRFMYRHMDEKSRLMGMSGEERYNYFLEQYPRLVNRIPIGQISQFLGIHHASLSRIRRKMSQLNNPGKQAV